MNATIKPCPYQPELISKEGQHFCRQCGENLQDSAALIAEKLQALQMRDKPPCIRLKFRPDGQLVLRMALSMSVALSGCVHHEDRVFPEVESGFMEVQAIHSEITVPAGQLWLTVVEHHGFVLPEATVQLWQGAEKVFEGRTDAKGATKIPDLLSGPYTLTIMGSVGRKTLEIEMEDRCGATGVVEVVDMAPLYLGRLESVSITSG